MRPRFAKIDVCTSTFSFYNKLIRGPTRAMGSLLLSTAIISISWKNVPTRIVRSSHMSG